MKNKLILPKFKNDQEENLFWQNLDLDKYFEANDFENITFPNLKPSSQSIAIRIPKYLLVRVKEQANALNIPYQSLIKTYIKKGLIQNLT